MSPPAAPPPPQNPIQSGADIGQYKLIKVLGKGGFGEVWKALDQKLKRLVAIKFLLGQYQDDPEIRRRFEAEAVLATRITHASLVQFFGTGETADGALYHIMEFVDGESLHSRLQPTPESTIKLDLALALDIAWQVASILAPLHAKGIVHRDLKPLNLMLAADETMPHGLRVKLLDFGIAKMTDKVAARELDIEQHTTQGPHPGSNPVMAPEQWRTGAEQGPEIDVYALGVILYRMLTGIWLFKGNWRVGHEILDPPLITKEDPSIPVDVAMLVHQMLMKNPAERPTMAKVRDQLGSHPSLKNASAGQVMIKSTMEMGALAAELSSSDRATADRSGSGQAADSARGPAEQLDANTSARNGQQVAVPTVMSNRRRRRNQVAVGLGVAAVLSVGALVIGRVSNLSSARPAPVASPLATLPESRPALPDLGPASVTNTAAKPSGTIPAASEPKQLAPEKKHKKKKDGLLLHD